MHCSRDIFSSRKQTSIHLITIMVGDALFNVEKESNVPRGVSGNVLMWTDQVLIYPTIAFSLIETLLQTQGVEDATTPRRGVLRQADSFFGIQQQIKNFDWDGFGASPEFSHEMVDPGSLHKQEMHVKSG